MELVIIFILVVLITILTEQCRYIDILHDEIAEIKTLVIESNTVNTLTVGINNIIKKYEK